MAGWYQIVKTVARRSCCSWFALELGILDGGRLVVGEACSRSSCSSSSRNAVVQHLKESCQPETSHKQGHSLVRDCHRERTSDHRGVRDRGGGWGKERFLEMAMGLSGRWEEVRSIVEKGRVGHWSNWCLLEEGGLGSVAGTPDPETLVNMAAQALLETSIDCRAVR